ncbi:MAG: hypothetical protein ACE5KA_08105 [Nitrososphaerales archaeon]
MDKKDTTMVASIAIAILVSAVLFVSGVLNVRTADADSSRFTTTSSVIGSGEKIIVEIESPYGFERISSFKTFNTSNLMKKGDFHTLKLQGTVMNDKRTLLDWIARDIGEMPDGLAADGIVTHGGMEVKMTKPKEGATVEKIAITGKVTLIVLEGFDDMYATNKLREIEFSGCHIAGYHLGTLYDNDRPYSLENRLEHYEQVDFACTAVKDLKSDIRNNRGITVLRPFNERTQELENEKGELIITSREYREPVTSKKVDQKIVATAELEKTHYKIGEIAIFTVTFTDLEGNAIDPDTIKAVYDGKMIQLKRQDIGIYTYATDTLTKEHHQLIVNAEKKEFDTDTTFLSIPIHRIS